MSESVNLPALGESVTEGTVTRWLKNVGDSVEVDEPLLEVSTDKVDTEIPSPVAGVIEEILVQEDETVEVGTALVRIGDGSGAAAEEPAPAAEEPAPAAEPAPATEETPAQETPAAEEEPEEAVVPSNYAEPGDPVPAPAEPEPAPAAEQEQPAASEQPMPAAPAAPAAPPAPAAAPAAPTPAAAPAASTEAPSGGSNAGYVTPLVRKLAHEKGVDLSGITGTGVGGRIRKEDVLAAAEKAATPAAAAPTEAKPAVVEISPLRGTTVKMSRLRKVVADRAVKSMQASAQLTSVVEVDVTKVAEFRNSVKDRFAKETGSKLSFLPFFALAATEALKSYPIVNATIDVENSSIVYPDHENISIAVDTERGLLTPVVKNAGDKNLADFAREIADLAARTRDNKLTPDELAGGTFTLTNTGSRGALFDTPVVFLPQVAILGTGTVVKRPVVISQGGVDAIAVRSMVYLALSYDHRIVDGADAARFLVQVKNRLEAGDFAADLGI
ncbi:2-oxoglutarate dehydrogenase, E2 component, dihydrolipoamide succinyltransferase [Planctomonas deserti]|uniref:2-oxoglutarate dehydrogenase, E2 component, dihydrolipoamide succinyltransferase n=1 Tax=Planctomonas deserti TaxID=2144185 RepID=UPI000D35DB42|nr:2-oxoglutarate dehydrogenase, E2 component, dihydrolipoamide succinyltransferase [Planctomonas deserti]